MAEIFPLKGKIRKAFGWIIIISSDVAFIMITLLSLKRLWVSEENQQPFVDFFMLVTDFGLGMLEIILAIYMVWLLIKLIMRKIEGITSA